MTEPDAPVPVKLPDLRDIPLEFLPALLRPAPAARDFSSAL